MPLIPSPGPRPTTPTVTATIIDTPTVTQVQGEYRYVYNVASGTTLYAVDLQTLFDPFPYTHTIPPFNDPIRSDAFFDVTNHGTIWMSQFPGPNAYGGRFFGRNFASFTNTGLVVMETVGEIEFGSVLTFLVDPLLRLDVVNNSGSIYILNTTANSSSGATFLTTYNYAIEITNSGLIAVQSAGGMAYGIGLANGGHIVNTATGQILIEGISAVGVSSAFSMAPIGIENYGRIEVNSLGSDPGIAVKIVADEIYNYATGTIIGDVAVFGSGRFNNAGLAVGLVIGTSDGFLNITNQAGGQIQGSVYLGDVEDVLLNQGTITGDVSMGAGADLVDNRGGGIITGIIDLGLGSDTYHGQGGQDLVAGDSGNDTIFGYAGEDLLLGGFGNDTLNGGTGADGLYGEGGNDVIVTLGADYVNGGTSDDEVRLGDYTFAFASGGAGFDTLVLAGGARVFDLSAGIASARLTDFEAVRLVGGQELVLRGSDVQGLSGGETELVVTLTATDQLDLVGAWQSTGPVTRGGVTYASYGLNGLAVLVGGTGTVAVMASAPAGASGLDAVAAGAPAPPLGTGGLTLSPPVLFVQYLEIREDTVIDYGDTWYTVGSYPALWSQIDGPHTTVNGTLQSFNPNSAGSYAIAYSNQQTVVINGLVGSYSDGALLAQIPDYFPSTPEGANAIVQAASVTNNGVIEAVSWLGTASGVGMTIFSPGMDGGPYGEDIPDTFRYNSMAPTVVNNGRIEAVSQDRHAFGVSGTQSFTNGVDAVVRVTGYLGAAAVVGEGSFTNHGTISAELIPGAPGRSFGIAITNDAARPAGHLVTNTGSITAQYAIWVQDVYGNQGFAPNTFTLNNSGQIQGAIRSGNGNDILVNTGTITGVIELRDGNDSFDGRSGTQAGAIHGGAGNDTIEGGSGNETLSGGTGFDVLRGFGGDDTLLVLSAGDVLAGETYDGGAGTDTLFFDFAADPAPIVDLTGVSLISIERIDGLGGVTVRLTAAQLDAFNWINGPDLLVANGGTIDLSGAAIGISPITLSDAGNSLNLAGATLIAPNIRILINGGAGNDTVIGSSGFDSLQGWGGNDTLLGGDGDDFLYGGLGADNLSGGNGDDQFYIGAVAEMVPGDVISGGDGFDTLNIYPTDADGDFSVLSVSGVERLGSFGAFLLSININAIKAFAEVDGAFRIIGSGAHNLAGQIITSGIFQLDNLITAFDISGATTGSVTVEAGSGDNTLIGSARDDYLLGGGGNDTLHGGDDQDWLYGDGQAGQIGNDTLFGEGGNDIMFGGAGDDLLDGGSGTNQLYGEGGNDRLVLGLGSTNEITDGGEGYDTLDLQASLSLTGTLLGIERVELNGFQLALNSTQFNGGLAFNAVIAGSGSLFINMVAGEALLLSQMNIAATVEINIVGTSGGDVIKGPLSTAMIVQSGDGADQIRTGNLADTIVAGAGNDKIMGLAGADFLTGGAGADQFRYLFANDSGLGAGADRILDFSSGTDKLDFRILDADPVTAGRQALSYIGSAAFATNGTAQVRHVSSGADTLVQIDLDGNGAADMEIVLVGHAGQPLAGTDFLL